MSLETAYTTRGLKERGMRYDDGRYVAQVDGWHIVAMGGGTQ